MIWNMIASLGTGFYSEQRNKEYRKSELIKVIDKGNRVLEEIAVDEFNKENNDKKLMMYYLNSTKLLQSKDEKGNLNFDISIIRYELQALSDTFNSSPQNDELVSVVRKLVILLEFYYEQL